jgi:protein-disulfide isomerase
MGDHVHIAHVDAGLTTGSVTGYADRVSSRPLTVLALLLATAELSCSSSGHVRSEPVDLSEVSTEPDPSAESASQAAPEVDWEGISPAQRSDVLEVLNATFCPACLCAETVAQCLTPEEPCGCPACAQIMARFVLDAFRQGMSAEEVLDLNAEAWVDAFEQPPIDLPLDDQPTRRAAMARDRPGTEPISVVEFADFTCPHCAAIAPILDALVESHADVRLAYFFYPLRASGPSLLSAQAAREAFIQGRFWSYARALYEQPRPPERSDLLALAQQVGLDHDAVAAALEDERHKANVLADKHLGESIGIRGTPAIYIEGRPFVLPRTLDNLEIWVDMERTRRQCAPGAD